MRLRKLRIALSVAWGIVSVLLCVLWVRSFWWYDIVACYRQPRLFQVSSCQGSLVYSSHEKVFPQSKTWMSHSARITSVDTFPLILNGKAAPRFLGFGRYTSVNLHVVFVPYWLLIAAAMTLGAAAWPQWKKRFSLRTLIIATTLVAVVLGLIVSLC
jgi:hypothetical protein